MEFGHFLFDDGPGEIDPVLAAVENGAVAAGYGLIRICQLRIGAWQQINRPVPVVLAGQLENQHFQPPAVRDGAVKQPPCTADPDFAEEPTDKFHGGYGFGNLTIGSMNARQVSETPVPAFEYSAAADSCLDGYQSIVTVDGNGLTGNFLYRHTPLAPAGELLVRTGTSHDGQPLPFGKREPVAHQF